MGQRIHPTPEHRRVRDYTTFRDSRRETTTQCVSRVLVAHPGLLTVDYMRLCVGHRPKTVKGTLHRLKMLGYCTSRRVHGRIGNGVDWHPTMELRRLIESGEFPSVPRSLRAADVLPDDGWTPPINYVGGTRAVILGLRRAA